MEDKKMNSGKRMKTGFSTYWKLILRESWKKSWDKWGMWGFIFPALASLLFAIITNWEESLSFILGEQWFLYSLIFLGLYLLTVTFYFVREPVILYNKQQDRIDELRNNLATGKANIRITTNQPLYSKKSEAGIFIQNNDEYSIVARVKILSNLKKQTDFFNFGISKDVFTIIRDENCIIASDIEAPIERNETGELIFVEVVNEEDIMFLLRKQVCLKSFYGERSGTNKVAKVKRVRWAFTFEVYGTINNQPFNNGPYSTYIEAELQGNTVFVGIGEIQSLA